MVWIIKKGISCLLILLGVTFVTFALMYLAGGDAISYFYENHGTAVSQEIMDAMRKKYGLDQPFLLQYGHWLLHALTGDMGESYVSGRAVLPLLASKIPHTLYLAAVSVALTLMVSVPLGVLSAVRKGGWCDFLAGGLSFLGNAMPNFFVAILLIYLLAVKLKWFPAVSVGTSPSVVLPAVTLAIAMSAKYTRQIRGVVLAELRKGYVMGARARGVSEGTILWKSVIPMASPAIVTLLAISIGSLLSGTAVVETIFLWDGVGKLAVDAIMQRDYPIIQAYVVWMAGIYILVNGAGMWCRVCWGNDDSIRAPGGEMMKKMNSSRLRLYLWGGLLLALMLCMMLARYLIPWDPYAQDLSMAQQPPSAMHLLGTDRYGRDMLARVLVGGRTSISGALIVVVLITAIGAGVGTGSGWYGGRIEQAWMGLSDVFLAFPGLVLALAVAGVSGGGMLQAVLALAAIGWPKYARLPSQERSC